MFHAARNLQGEGVDVAVVRIEHNYNIYNMYTEGNIENLLIKRLLEYFLLYKNNQEILIFELRVSCSSSYLYIAGYIYSFD